MVPSWRPLVKSVMMIMMVVMVIGVIRMPMDGNDKSEAETETRVRGGCVMSLLNYSYTMDNDDNDDD